MSNLDLIERRFGRRSVVAFFNFFLLNAHKAGSSDQLQSTTAHILPVFLIFTYLLKRSAVRLIKGMLEIKSDRYILSCD